MTVIAPFAHEASARRLIHRLKYDGLTSAGEVLAAAMAPLLPSGASALVPVPRATIRKVRYGMDPAVTLARMVSVHAEIPVVAALRPQLWWPAHAGSNKASRRPPRFRSVASVPDDSVLVDDVFTTGATLDAAAEVVGLNRALTATRAGRM